MGAIQSSARSNDLGTRINENEKNDEEKQSRNPQLEIAESTTQSLESKVISSTGLNEEESTQNSGVKLSGAIFP
jgi:hypothetical protein